MGLFKFRFQNSDLSNPAAVSDGADQRIIVLNLSVGPLVCELLPLHMSRWL